MWAPPSASIAAICLCTWSTTASVKKPRATPDWFVTMTTARPAPLLALMASIVHGPVTTAHWSSKALVGWSEHRRHVHAQRSREVQSARVVADERAAIDKDGSKRGHVGLANEINICGSLGPGPQHVGYGVPVFGGAHQHVANPRVCQSGGEVGERALLA